MNKHRFDAKFIVAVVTLSLAMIFVYKSILLTPSAAHEFTKTFPSRISFWIGDAVIYDKDVLISLDTDKTVYNSYHKNGAPPITLFMGCYNNLAKADLSHSPIVCFTGQGWEVSETSKAEIPIDFSDIQRIEVNQLVQKRLDATMITLFWYQTERQAFSNRGVQKIRLFFDKLLGKQDKNAFVRVTITVPPAGRITDVMPVLHGFISDLYPELIRFFSDA